MKRTLISRLRLKFLLTLAVAFLVFVVALASYSALSTAHEVGDRIKRSAAIRSATEKVVVALLDTESGQRGFLLTLDARYLVPYEDGRKALDRAIDELAALTDTVAQQAARCELVRTLTRQKLTEMARTVELARAGKQGEALTLVATDIGMDLMARVRGELAQIRADEDAPRQTLEAEAESSFDWTRVFLLLATVGGLGLALLVNLYIRRDVVALEEANNVVVRQAEQLEALAADLSTKAAELERSNSDLDQFAYVTSHDLKAPLRAITNLSDWIAEDVGDRLGTSGREHLRLMKSRVKRLEALIDGILAYSRAGRGNEKSELVDVGALVRETIELIEPPKEVRITVAAGLPRLRTEKAPLQQVLMNLVTNALKHGKSDAPAITIGGKQEGDGWVFSVGDNGPGIDPAFHDKIFVLFQTLESRDKVEGSGIGLAVVRKLVEARGERVWVESKRAASPSDESGATFYFSWREAGAAGGLSTAAGDVSPPAAGGTAMSTTTR